MRNSNKEKLKLTDYLNGKYSSRSVLNSTWISDTEITFIDVNGNFVLYNVDNQTSQTVVTGALMVRAHSAILIDSLHTNKLRNNTK